MFWKSYVIMLFMTERNRAGKVQPVPVIVPERRIGGLSVSEYVFRATSDQSGIGNIPGRRRLEPGAPDSHPRSR